MRHRKKGKTLDRNAQTRRMMLKNMASSLILYERIITTPARAKAVKIIIDRAIVIGRRGDLTSRRQLIRLLPVANAVAKVMEELGPRYRGRAGGYTRTMKLGNRHGDNAEMVNLELV